MKNKAKLKFSQEIIIYTNGCKSPFSSYYVLIIHAFPLHPLSQACFLCKQMKCLYCIEKAKVKLFPQK